MTQFAYCDILTLDRAFNQEMHQCVNKRKNRRSRYTWDNYITRCPRRFEPVGVSWGQNAEVRASGRQRALGPQWPTVEQPQPRWERSAAMVRRTFGRNNGPSLSPLTSHTQETSPFRELSVRDIFIKKYVRSFIEVRHYCWQCFRLYLYYEYATLRADYFYWSQRNIGRSQISTANPRGNLLHTQWWHLFCQIRPHRNVFTRWGLENFKGTPDNKHASWFISI